MNPKNQQKLAHKLVTLNYLLLDTLDDLNPSTAEILEYKTNLVKLAELLSDTIVDTEVVQRTSYFQDLCNKVDTVIRKNLNYD